MYEVFINNIKEASFGDKKSANRYAKVKTQINNVIEIKKI